MSGATPSGEPPQALETPAAVGSTMTLITAGLPLLKAPIQGRLDLSRVLDLFAVGPQGIGHAVEVGESKLPGRVFRRSLRAVQPALLLMTQTTGRLCRTAVSISMALRPMEPSPCRTSTGLPGLATCAPKP